MDTRQKAKPKYINNSQVQAPAPEPLMPAQAPSQEQKQAPVYGICGHLAKSPYHSCGCEQYYW